MAYMDRGDRVISLVALAFLAGFAGALYIGMLIGR